MNIVKRLPVLGALVVTFCIGANALAQSPVALATRKPELQALAEFLQQRDAADRAQAAALARGVGLPLRRDLPNGRVLELQRWTRGKPPEFYLTYNTDAADTASTDEVWPGGTAGLSLTGGGMTAGIWDGGAVYGDHDDLTGRVTQLDGATTLSGHATHVAGTLIGDGGSPFYPDARGMAWQAALDARDWNSDTAEMAAAAADGLLISNHSYGIAAGWVEIEAGVWWWIGGADNYGQDPNFGYYDTEAAYWDEVALNAPYYLIVKAAGNDRMDFGPPSGTEYTVVDAWGNPLYTDTAPREADCAPLGFDCLPTVSVAKNLLTVGAVDDVIGGYSPLSGASSVKMTSFSGWGPTDDGRIKPDLVANGELLLSTYLAPYNFAAASGTSMAAPNVTGSLLLLQEHHENLNGPGQYLRAATLKALAIQTADEAGEGPGPDYIFGWGLLNTKKAADVISGDGTAHRIVEAALSDGATDSHAFTVSDPNTVLRATLVWADPPGTPAAPSLDPPARMLVNDLDLRVTKDGTTWEPWILDPASPGAPATTGDNTRDNVEQVVAEGGTGTYTVQVSHKGALENTEQDYSLVLSATLAPPTGGGLLVDEDFSTCLPPGWSVDTETGVSWTCRPQPGDSGSRYVNDTGGSGTYVMVDVAYSTYTVASLVMPALDLSSMTGAVLRFKSHWIADTAESYNVDLSTDGGSSWTAIWQEQGMSAGFPQTKTLDLSGMVAGEADVRIRFRFDGGYLGISGDFWKIDDVELETFGDGDGGGSGGGAPGPASAPVPGNGAMGVAIDADLGWSAGSGADSHEVYFGTEPTPDNSESQGNQAGTTFDPGTLAHETTYYWRVDEVNADGTTTGTVWSFTTVAAPLSPPETATAPAPVDGATGVGIATDLTWTAGPGAESHDVYFGTVNPPAFQGNQAGTTFDPGTLAHSTTYYWRVDEVNGDGTTEGAVWNFTTEAAPTETVELHLAGLDGSDQPGSRGRWTALVTALVHDAAGTPQSGVAVDGSWSGGANGGGFCETGPDGSCTLEKANLKNNVASVTFTVSALTRAGAVYDSAANTVADSVTVSPGGDDGGGDSGGGGDTGGTEPMVSLTPSKQKGEHHVDVAWSNFSSDAVDIHRDTNPVETNVAGAGGSGSYHDAIGAKGGASYVYEVCEAGTTTCVSATVTF